MSDYGSPMKLLFGCLIGAGILIGIVVGAAVMWWLA